MTINKDKLFVTKRDGRRELVDIEKIHKVLYWAAEDLNDVSVSMVEMKSHIQLYDGITTKDIHETLIKTAADLISPEFPDYQYMAARLAIFNIRKTAYGDYNPPTLKQHLERHITNLETNEGNKYDNRLLKLYSSEELEELDEYIDHNRDLNLAYAATQQMIGKYLVQDRVSKQLYESPQMLFMLVAMAGFINYPKDTRLGYVKRLYDALSKLEISLPTPIMGGLRTPTKQFSSCVTINCGDSLDSINASSNAIVNYISQRAGIGLNAGAIRALGSPIRGGEAVHTGTIPFYKLFQAAVKSCSQGALRGGAATLFYPIWHLEVESLLVLKNNKGVEDNRVRHLDYGVQINKLFYQRLIKDENITLFSPHDVTDMYDAFFADQEKFEELYLKYEQDESIRKKVVSAKELFSSLMLERANTGRIYIQNVDHCNTHGSFLPEVAPITQSNLCVSGDTKVLTKKYGYDEISSLVYHEDGVEIWNGEEWSNVQVRQTSERSDMIAVVTKSGKRLRCTPYHKFYIETENGVKQTTAGELQIDDVLLKCDFPVIETRYELSDEYVIKAANKRKFIVKNKKVSSLSGRIEILSVKNRITWLSTFLDRFGTKQTTSVNPGISVYHKDLWFLYRVRELLEITGATADITLGEPEIHHLDQIADGRWVSVKASQTYLLSIHAEHVLKLLELGLNLSRLKITKEMYKDVKPYFDSITHITYEASGPTYCFTEPKRNMGVFNGILAGNCMEITLPTSPISVKDPTQGEISLCTLAAVNLGNIGEDKEMYTNMKERTELLVRLLDEILDYQDYPIEAARKSTLNRRPLGIGVINYAYWLAKQFKSYDESALEPTHRLFEALQYYSLEASNELAKEKGACEWFSQTKYSKGILPIDTYKKEVDNICKVDYCLDWNKLRESIKEHGLRNSTLTSLMPSETSSQVSNATNGIEPPRGLVSVKTSKDGIIKQVVPEVDLYGTVYPLLWKLPSNTGYLQLVAVMQKFVDQSISANTNYDPSKFENGKVPMKTMIGDVLTAYKLGVKTLYYHNTRDGADDSQLDDDGCAGGACKI